MNQSGRAIVKFPLVAFLIALVACSGGEHPVAPVASSQDSTQSPWLAVARGKVDVMGGMVRVTTQRDGVIDAVDVQAGDEVQARQVLAQLDPRSAQIDLAGMRAQAEQARAQLSEIAVKLREAQRRAPRLAAAAKAGAATGDAADEARNEVADLTAQRDAAKAALDVARQRVAAAQLGVDARSLRAPVAGRIVQREAQIGQSVSAQSGTALFVILPDRPRIVRAELDAGDADSIKPGMSAQVVRDSGQGPVWTAKVLLVGEVLGQATLNDDPLARAASREVECTLQLQPVQDQAGHQPFPRIGQRVLVRFPR